MATRAMHAMGQTEEKMYALHSFPSPTLTNPDMVLPNEPMNFTPLPSPPRQRWKNRLPTPKYVKDTPTESARTRSSSSGSAVIMSGTKEKRGLMSRKMMLLRSRTSSSNMNDGNNGIPRAVVSDDRVSSDYGSMYGSSPTLMDVGNLAPEQPDQKRLSSNGGTSVGDTSVDSDEMRAAREFLAKYEASNPSGTDDELDTSSLAPKDDDNASVITGLEDHRRRQEEEEQNSAMLSKRAEEILANAKQRLNLMEGNLRGARDLVQPLTAANLKRATSIGSSFISPSTTRFVQDGFYHESPGQQQFRGLQTKASSPTIGRDYQGHWRGFSELGLPDRPHTALDRAGSPIVAQGRIPSKANDPGWTHTLKSVASHDSLGISAIRRPASRDIAYGKGGKGSPDPSLSTLVEDDGRAYPAPPRSVSSRTESQNGSSFYRPASRTEDLREQMSSLKGKISNLKEKAKEDRLRRQSQQNLREPSPLNNAAVDPPELFYASSPTYGSPALNAQAGKGWTSSASPDNSPTQRMFDPAQMLTGSRNAFAEQAQRQRTPDVMGPNTTQTNQSQPSRPQTSHGKIEHRRTPSGTTIIQSSKHRYSHHQYYHVRDMQATYGDGEHPIDDSEKIGVAHGGTSVYDDGYSEAGASVYEDAETEQPAVIVAHEDRADAFDYEQFFLSSAIATYGDGRRTSVSSEESVSSVETARGPTLPSYDADGDDELDEEDEDFPPGTPQTPEKLRAIERNLHRRTFSDESVSTLASFATAIEGRDTPPITSSRNNSAMDWPISPSAKISRPSSSMSRPKTAIPVKQAQLATSDSASDRADSGVGLNGRSDSSKNAPARTIAHKSSLSISSRTTTSPLSPPMSPRIVDPATVAVNTFLQADGRQLGLKDKALLFGLVDSLKKVCNQLQDSDGIESQSQVLRRRLEAARKMLDGEGAV